MAAKGTVTIANGAATSGALYTGGSSVVTLLFPDMTSASCTVQVSRDGSTFKTVGNENGDLKILAPANRAVALDPIWTLGVNFVKVVAVGNEGAERAIDVVFENYLT